LWKFFSGSQILLLMGDWWGPTPPPKDSGALLEITAQRVEKNKQIYFTGKPFAFCTPIPTACCDSEKIAIWLSHLPEDER
jgi:hypothetical protein